MLMKWKQSKSYTLIYSQSPTTSSFHAVEKSATISRGSEGRTFNRSWQVVTLAERTVCRLQCIPSLFTLLPLLTPSKCTWGRILLWSQEHLFSFRYMMRKMMIACCCTASLKTIVHTDQLQQCKPNCLHHTLFKLKCCWFLYTTQQMETM